MAIAPLSIGIVVVGVVGFGSPAIAQIMPDRTLGGEASRVNRDVEVRGDRADRIDGGALRGGNLFHSFEQFNVGELERVYFSNPAGIENILGRVTGDDVSDIFGTLGVDGNANLFFLNPNGVVFGENARLDIAGSFVASTGDRFLFPDGSEFSATNPAAPPLLTVNLTPGIQYGRAAGNIRNDGVLYAGHDLSLHGHTLNLEGQLWAGGDLSLLADRTVRIRDSLDAPFIAAARGDLLVEGDRAVDIFALNHPDSELWSGGDMTLRSASPVGGDAHFYSGGNFRIEQMDQSLGELYSPYDPIIRSLGDVSFEAYQGTSLHILAAGDVTVSNYIQIFGEPAPGEEVIVDPGFTLSDGSLFPIDGLSEPTVDIRAGVDPAVIESLGGEEIPTFGNFFGTLDLTPPPVDGANIEVGTIIFGRVASATLPPEFLQGRVLLTNQYLPDPNNPLPGNIRIFDTQVNLPNNNDLNGVAIRAETPNGGGLIAIDSRGNIDVQGSIKANAVPINAEDIGDNPTLTPIYAAGADGGNITLLADGDITLEAGTEILPNRLDSFGEVGGDITLRALGNIIFQPNSMIDSTSKNSDNPLTNFSTIQIESINGSVFINQSTIAATNTGNEVAGDIFIDAESRIEIENESFISADGNFGRIFLGSSDSNLANDSSFPETISIRNSILTTTNAIINGTDDAGDITLRSQNIILDNESFLFADTNFDPAASPIDNTATGNGGDINIFSQILAIKRGSEILSRTFTAGNGGDITIEPLNLNAPSSVLISGVAPSRFEFETLPDGTVELETGDFSSGLFSTTEIAPIDSNNDGINDVFVDSTGEGGNINVTTGHLILRDGGVISTRTNSLGDAQNITLNVDRLEITNGGQILSASIFSDPNGISQNNISSAGNIEVTASEGVFISGYDETYNNRFRNFQNNLRLAGENLISAFQRTRQTFDPISPRSGIQATDIFGFGEAGNIKVDSPVVVLSELSNIDATTSGNLDAGDIIVRTQNLIISGGASITTATIGGFRNPITDESGTISYAPSTGNAGNIIVEPLNPNSPSSVRISGTALPTLPDIDLEGNPVVTPGGFSSSLLATSERFFLPNNTFITTSGDSGEIRVGASSNPFSTISLDDGAIVGTRSRSLGDAGDIEVHTGSLNIIGGSQVVSAAFGLGNAGNVTVNASRRINISGFDPTLGDRFTEVAQAIIAQSNAEGFKLTLNQALDNARGFVDLIGPSEEGSLFPNNAPSGIQSFAAILAQESPLSGDITVTGRAITLSNGSEINSESSNQALDNFSTVELTATRGDISINGSSISTTNFGTGFAGDIRITSPAEVRVENQSFIVSQGNFGQILIGNDLILPGSITINGGSSVRTDNQNAEGVGFAETQQAGRISLRARNQINVSGDNTQISSATFNEADAGSIFFKTAGTVSIRSGATVFSTVESGANGNGGEINVETRNFELLSGAQLQTQVNRGSRGNAGRVLIEASNEALFDNSAVFSSIAPQARGQAGLIIISGNIFERQGTLFRITPSDAITFRNGAQLIADTAGLTRRSNAGDIFIVANEITFDGFNDPFPTAVFSGVSLGGEGQGGNIYIAGEVIFEDRNVFELNRAEKVSITDGALLTVSSFGFDQGRISGLGRDEAKEQRAGNIFISSRILDMSNDNVNLNGERGIFAETGLGGGGNIYIDIERLLLLRGGTRISTTAGRRVEPGDGGNIFISADDEGFIVAEPFGNNDITADSVIRNGGRVQIEAEQIFGLFFRTRDELADLLEPDSPLDPDRLPTSDVTAISQFDASLDGRILVNTEGVDPSRGLTELPSNLVDGSQLVAETCPSGADTVDTLGEFIVTGRGGLPPNPGELLDSTEVRTHWIGPDATGGSSEPEPQVPQSQFHPAPSTAEEPLPIVEAEGWRTDAAGRIVLVASTAAGAPSIPGTGPTGCPR